MDLSGLADGATAWAPPLRAALTDLDTRTSAQALALAGKLDIASATGVSQGLAQWRKARAAMATAPAKILCIGDSITEGGLALSVTARWTSQLAALIAARYAVPTSTLGYLTPRLGVGSTVNPLTVTNGTTEVNWGVSCGNGTLLTATTGKVAGTVTGTAIDVHYLRTTGTGTFTVKVDGVQVGGAYGGTAGAITDGYVQRVAMGAAGSHTIEIIAGAASVYITGVNVLNGNTTSGLQVFNAGYSGALAVKYAVPNGVNWWQQALAGVSPHLVILMWNANDYASATPLATFQGQLETMIANIRTGVAAQPQPSILLVTPPKISYAPVSPAQWETYTHAMRTVAKRDGSAEFFDLGSLMPDIGSTAGNASGYYSADPTHPNAAGHARMAAIIDEILTDRPVV